MVSNKKHIVVALCINLVQVSYLCQGEELDQKRESPIEPIDPQLLNDELIKSQNMQPMTAYIMGDLPKSSNAYELTRLALQSKLYYAVYNDLFMQRYDNLQELDKSGGPQLNHELCLKHLGHLVERAGQMRQERYKSYDVNLARLLDSYGRRPSGVYLGSGYWPGSYQECLRTSIDTPDGQVPSRYCVAHIRPTEFKMNKVSLIDKLTFFKSGVCLPRSCDSMNYKNKLELIEKLMDYNSRTPVEPLEGNLTHLYCLPDSESPLRAWWSQPKTVAVVILMFGWIGLLVFATVRARGTTNHDLFSSLSFANNLRRLFATSQSNKDGTLSQQQVVDLSVVDGIKVLSMMYIIIAHVLMCMMHVIDDGTELRSSFLFALANMSPAFAVNAFFGITALLTSYMMFKHNHTIAMMKNPIRWPAMLLQRYMRIMPMYIIVVVYAKYLSRYTGTGPFWDYGTSELSHRRTCEQESWLWTLLFGANFKNPLSHCLETGWYLALDFQFLAVTPLFLIALQLRPQLGKVLIIFVIISAYCASFLDTINSKIDDFSILSSFMSHGFKTYVTHMSGGYTFPHFRIPAYLCGLLAGYYLFEHERDKVESKLVKKCKQLAVLEDNICRIPDWHPSFKKYTPSICVFFVLLVGCTPFFARYPTFDKATTRVITATILPLAHIGYSLSASLFTLMAATGNGIHHLNSFLSAKVWKPLARLSLCAVLINVEVVHYITEVKTQLMNLDFISHLPLNLIAIIAVYTISALLFVLFESPIKVLLNLVMFPEPRKSTQQSSEDPINLQQSYSALPVDGQK